MAVRVTPGGRRRRPPRRVVRVHRVGSGHPLRDLARVSRPGTRPGPVRPAVAVGALLRECYGCPVPTRTVERWRTDRDGRRRSGGNRTAVGRLPRKTGDVHGGQFIPDRAPSTAAGTALFSPTPVPPARPDGAAVAGSRRPAPSTGGGTAPGPGSQQPRSIECEWTASAATGSPRSHGTAAHRERVAEAASVSPVTGVSVAKGARPLPAIHAPGPGSGLSRWRE